MDGVFERNLPDIFGPMPARIDGSSWEHIRLLIANVKVTVKPRQLSAYFEQVTDALGMQVDTK